MIPWARIIIVVYNSSPDLQICVNHLAHQIFTDFEVKIVNNQTPDDCIKTLKLPDERFEVLEADDNLGFAAGCNFGAKGAEVPWLIMLNPDAFAAPEWLQTLHSAAERHAHIAVLSSTLIQAEDRHLVDGFGDVMSIYGIAWRGAYGHPVENLPDNDALVFGPCGAAAAYRRDAFETIGGFDPAYFCYLEDVDLAYRYQRAGYDCLQVRPAIVYHRGAGSTEKGGEFQFYQAYKNNLRLIVKSTPPLLLCLVLPIHWASQHYLIFRNRNNPHHAARIKGRQDGRKGFRDAWHARGAIKNLHQRGSLAIFNRLAKSRKGISQLHPKFWRK